jgi:hypothetical protein
MSLVSTDFDEPILFRTASEDVCKSTLETGMLWLRSDQYYREIEDKARNDASEGVNSGTTSLPLQLQAKDGPQLQIYGDGGIGQQIRPHYIVSLHGSSISSEVRKAFGGHTFGIRNFSRLVVEVVSEASKIASYNGWRFGQIMYQYAALAQSLNSNGGAAVQYGHNPAQYLNPVNTDVLRKLPVEPFIKQDEWRIAVFVNKYIENDPKLPLKIKVSTTHFYPYLVAH